MQAVVASDGCGAVAEDHAKRDSGSRIGAAAMGFWQEW